MSLLFRKQVSYFIFLALFSLCASGQDSLKINGISNVEEPGTFKAIVVLHLSELSNNPADILASTGDQRMEYRFYGDRVSRRGFVRKIMEGVAVNTTERELELYGKDLLKFSQLLRVKLQPEDQLLFDINDKGVRVRWNGTELGWVEEREFGRILLRAWLGDIPLSSRIKSELAVAGNIPADRMAKLEELKPSFMRIAGTAESQRNPQDPKSKNNARRAKKYEFSPPLNIPDGYPLKARNQIKNGSFHPTIKPRVVIDGDFPEGATQLEKAYIRHIRQQVVKWAHYPWHLAERGDGSEVLITMTVNQLGKTGHRIMKKNTSGDKAFQFCTDRAVRAASPFSPFPEEMNKSSMDVSFRFIYGS